MSGVVVIDTNLLLLLIVGAASKDYISKHKRLQGYSVDDFDLLVIIIKEFSDIVLLPHTLAEVSNVARNIEKPARIHIQDALRTLINTTVEIPIQSAFGAQRYEFRDLGLTDSVILHLCNMEISNLRPTLITVDTDLANAANSLGYSVIDYKKI